MDEKLDELRARVDELHVMVSEIHQVFQGLQTILPMLGGGSPGGGFDVAALLR